MQLASNMVINTVGTYVHTNSTHLHTCFIILIFLITKRLWQASGLGSELDQVTGWRPAATKGKANDDGERVGIRGLFGTTRKLKFLVAISIAVILDAIVVNILVAVLVAVAALLLERHGRTRPGWQWRT